MSVFFLLANFEELFLSFSFPEFIEKLAVLLAYLISAYVLNFIAKKNDLTQRSAYKFLLFALFTASFWKLLENTQVIFANLCVLFALRRIISLRTKKVMQKKVFDAAFWICVASIFYFWSILFLVVVYMGIFYYLPKFKNFLVPLVAFVTVAILNFTFNLVAYEELYGFWRWFQASNFDFSTYGSVKVLIPISIILALLVWTFANYFSLAQKAGISMRIPLNMIMISLIIAILLAVFASTKNGSELIFFFVPLSIIATTFFEQKKDRIFREVLLAILILMPIVVAFFPEV